MHLSCALTAAASNTAACIFIIPLYQSDQFNFNIQIKYYYLTTASAGTVMRPCSAVSTRGLNSSC